MAKKSKLPNVDGLGPKDIKKLRTAIRQVWSWSYAKKLVVKRCTDKNGFARCENPKCKKRKCPKIFVDHIMRCGNVDEGYIKRMFVPSKSLQGLCKICHDTKTRWERKQDEIEKGFL